ncbi:MAG: hypothetical protein M3Y37_09365 [Chloroflexota bacterium]|nr:hypothetical protein [Chloroflexota bacterium]
MTQAFRIVAWNCRRATQTSAVWDYLLELDPDIALLQEVSGIPDRVAAGYAVASGVPTTRSGRPQRFRTVLLAKGEILADIELPAPNDWVARELDLFKGNFIARSVRLESGFEVRVISVYCPAFPIDWSRLEGIDPTGIQLTQNRDVWPTEILWASLRSMQIGPADHLVAGGDFNSSETFDTHWGKPRGNLELMERMNALGLRDCLRAFQRRLVPTFRSPRGGSVIHQIDHLYVTPPLLQRLAQCDVGSSSRVFEALPALSDHLPIVADFRVRP